MAKGGKISLLLGVVTGAVTGLLFAPSKGKDLRKRIQTERQAGGIGHKAVAKELTKMADEVSDLVKQVAQSEEALQFWKNTNSKVSEWTEGSVELDEWVMSAHKKADELKKTVTKFANEKKKAMKTASGKAKRTVKRVKSKGKRVAKKAITRVKNGRAKAVKTMQKVTRKTQSSKVPKKRVKK